MSRTAVPPQPTPESDVPESAGETPAGRASGPVLDALPTAQADQPGTDAGRGAPVVDEQDDWDPPTPDIGEEDQSLEAPDDDAQSMEPYC